MLGTKTVRLATLAAAVLFAAGCENSNNGMGKVNVQLTDAPFPFGEVKSVDVYVVRIDGKTTEASDVEAADAGDSDGWVTLVSPNASINLLSLQKGNTANLGTATLPVGVYESFRLVIDPSQSSITLNDGSQPEIKWPSAGQSGIKIYLDEPFEVVDGTTNLLIDFDVGRSFVMRGNSISQNGLLFKPVIQAVTPHVAGMITGSVRADSATGVGLDGATVEVLTQGTTLTDTDPSKVVRSGVTDASGNYTIAFIPAGTYTVRATPTAASLYQPALLVPDATLAVGTVLSNQVIIVTK